MITMKDWASISHQVFLWRTAKGWRGTKIERVGDWKPVRAGCGFPLEKVEQVARVPCIQVSIRESREKNNYQLCVECGGHGRLLVGNGPQEGLEEQLDTEAGQWDFKQRERYEKKLLKRKPETVHRRGFIFCQADGSWKRFPADGSCGAEMQRLSIEILQVYRHQREVLR